jgi:hypothetical protein
MGAHCEGGQSPSRAVMPRKKICISCEISAENYSNISTLPELSSRVPTFLSNKEDLYHAILFPILSVNCAILPHWLSITATCVWLQIAETKIKDTNEVAVSILFLQSYSLQFGT